eukprot:COSAG06_NODE_2835_length_6201_cov_127.447722_9_plen_248_part_00
MQCAPPPRRAARPLLPLLSLIWSDRAGAPLAALCTGRSSSRCALLAAIMALAATTLLLTIAALLPSGTSGGSWLWGGGGGSTDDAAGGLPGWVGDARTICRDMEQTREMYTEAPYPPRDPASEVRTDEVAVDSKITPAAIAHHIHGGRFPTAAGSAGQQQPYRVLVAGGGTGDATVKYATYLANIGINAELVHMDLSSSSIATAEARLQAHKLHTFPNLNTRFILGNLSQIGAENAFSCAASSLRNV